MLTYEVLTTGTDFIKYIVHDAKTYIIQYVRKTTSIYLDTVLHTTDFLESVFVKCDIR